MKLIKNQVELLTTTIGFIADGLEQSLLRSIKTSAIENRNIYIVIVIVIVMATTIQISEVTKRMLNSLRKDSKKSYDKILQDILPNKLDTPKSLAGKFPDLEWSKKDRMKLKNE